jgi:hypothetical protein
VAGARRHAARLAVQPFLTASTITRGAVVAGRVALVQVPPPRNGDPRRTRRTRPSPCWPAASAEGPSAAAR